MPIIANQEPNYRAGDFVTTYPSAVVLCTDLPSSAFPDKADDNWVIGNISVAIGTFLGMHTRNEVDGLMKRLRKQGLRILVLDKCSTNEILSASVEKAAEELVQTTIAFSPDAKDVERFRIVGMLMADIFKKTNMIRYCWFFDSAASKKKRKRTDTESSHPTKDPTPAPTKHKKLWQFWK